MESISGVFKKRQLESLRVGISMGKDNVMSYHTHWTFTTDGQSRKVTCAIAKRKTLSIDTQMNSFKQYI